MRGFRKFGGKLKTVSISFEANQYHASLLFDDGKEFKKPKHIVIEKLKIKNMTKSATGTIKEPKKSSGKRGLNRAITQQSWGLFFEMLKYKAEKKGGEVIEVDPKFTTQKCSCCGHISKENRKSQSKFRCVKCNFRLNADLNASLNILNTVGHMEKAS
jgi:putative transposase